MKKRTNRALALSLAACMSLGTIEMGAFASEIPETDGVIEVESLQGGGTEEVDVIITVKKEDNVTNTEIKTDSEGDTTNSGANVKFEGSSDSEDEVIIAADEEYTVDAEGYGAQGGTEVSVTKGDGTEGDISMNLVDNKEIQEDISGSSNTAGETTTGDLKSEDSANYDQTTITTTDRTASVIVGDMEVTTGNPVYVDEHGNPIDKEAAVANGYNYYWSEIYTVDGKSIIDGEAPESKWKTGGTYGYIVNADGTRTQIHNEGVCQRVVSHDNGTPDDFSDDYEIGGLYCVDMNTGIRQELKYRKANLEDADYYTQDEINHLRAIMTYGYTWDDDDDLGYTNLENMKAMLKDAKENGDEATKELLKDMDIDNLTREQAATATGMAVWTYGNRIVLEEGQYIELTSREGNAKNKARIETLYKYLISLTKEADDNETQVINEEKFIDNMDMVVGAMVKDHANNKDNDDTNDAYSVDLKFSLVVDQIGNSDDLIVKVIDNHGNVIKTARIAGEQKDGEEFGYAEKTVDENNNTYYVLKGLELIENSNTTFNLKLEGVQMLEEGVYIFESQQLSEEEYVDQMINYLKAKGYYEAEVEYAGSEEALRESILKNIQNKPSLSRSQNFIGKFSGEAEIDVNMALDLTFNVEEATITTEHTWREEWAEETEEETEDPSLTDEEETEAETEEIPEKDPSYGAPSNGDSDLTEIGEEEVPMADAPETGDMSALLLVIAAVSGIGFSYVLKTDKKRNK